MARKPKSNKGVISDKEQLNNCIEFIKARGYGVFQLGSEDNSGEKESVEKLRSIGYKVEHIRDATLKVEPQKINSADDIAVYFYEKLRRHDKKLLDSNKLKDKKYRLVDCSVINALIKWRMGEGLVSLTEAIEDVFIMIDVLFEKASEWKINVYGVGILSITSNKPLVVTLLREANMRRDGKLNYEITYQIHTEDSYNYINMLEEAKALIKRTEVVKVKKHKREIKFKE
jgi:hypothetical protein